MRYRCIYRGSCSGNKKVAQIFNIKNVFYIVPVSGVLLKTQGTHGFLKIFIGFVFPENYFKKSNMFSFWTDGTV